MTKSNRKKLLYALRFGTTSSISRSRVEQTLRRSCTYQIEVIFLFQSTQLKYIHDSCQIIAFCFNEFNLKEKDTSSSWWEGVLFRETIHFLSEKRTVIPGNDEIILILF